MASVLHGSARTTPRIRAELQAAQTPSRAIALQYGINPKTVLKWRRRSTTADAPMGPKQPRSTVLTPAEEAIVVEFRRRTLLPLDDVMGCLKDTIPNLSRSALHRCLQRHGISRLPKAEIAETRKRFKTYEIGYVHIDSCELRHAEGKLVMLLAIDRVSKFTSMSNSTIMPGKWKARPSSRTSSRRSLTRSARCSPITAWRSPICPKTGKDQPGASSAPHLRSCLHGARDRAPSHKALPPLDQRPGRADEPNRQGRNRQSVPL